jgi:hypothetical protein
MADSFTILLQLLLDQASKSSTEQGMDDLTKSIKALEDAAQKSGNTFSKSFDELIKSGYTAKTAVERLAHEYKQFGGNSKDVLKSISDETQKSVKPVEKVSNATKDAAKETRKLKEEASGANKEIMAMEKSADKLREKASQISAFSKGLLAFSAATIGALYYASNKEANRQQQEEKSGGPKMSQDAKEWLTTQKEIEKSFQKIAAVAMGQLLPYLKQAADIAEKIASYVEKHPEAMKAIAGVGAIAGVVGVIGTLVSTVMKFGAFGKDMVAGIMKAMSSSATASTASTGGMLFAPASKAASAASSVAAFSTALSVLGGIVAGVKIYDLIAEIFGLQSAGEIGAKALAIFVYALHNLGLASDESVKKAFKYAKEIENTRVAAEKASAAVAGLGMSMSTLSSAAMAYGQYQQAQLATDQRYAQEKSGIEAKYTSQTQDLYRSHGLAMSNIAGQLSSTLASIEANYKAQMESSEANYQAQRAQIVQQGNEQIEQIQKDAQERLRELAQQHADRVEDLTNSRDALGLAQENRDYARQKAEEERKAREQMKEAREATAQQLAQLEQQHALEQAEMQRQYEAEKEQAKQQADEQSSQETIAFQQQLAALQKSKEEELKALDAAHQQEHEENFRSFNEKLNQLGIYLGNEYNSRQEWFNRMLDQTKAFLAAQSAMYAEQTPEETADGTTPPPAPGPNSPTHDSGGYANAGLIRIGKGQREFVLSDRTRRAAESAIGSRLTQENIMASLLRGSGGATQMVNVNVGNGMTVMQAKRMLKDAQRTMSNDLADAFASI